MTARKLSPAPVAFRTTSHSSLPSPQVFSSRHCADHAGTVCVYAISPAWLSESARCITGRCGRSKLARSSGVSTTRPSLFDRRPTRRFVCSHAARSGPPIASRRMDRGDCWCCGHPIWTRRPRGLASAIYVAVRAHCAVRNSRHHQALDRSRSLVSLRACLLHHGAVVYALRVPIRIQQCSVITRSSTRWSSSLRFALRA